MTEQQHHRFNVRVYFEDTDHFGMVYHANYIKYLERARSEWLREQGYALDTLYQQGFILVVHSVEINYIKPAKLNNDLTVVSHIENIQKTNVTFMQDIYHDQTLICKAAIRVACLDAQFKPRLFPEFTQFK